MQGFVFSKSIPFKLESGFAEQKIKNDDQVHVVTEKNSAVFVRQIRKTVGEREPRIPRAFLKNDIKLIVNLKTIK